MQKGVHSSSDYIHSLRRTRAQNLAAAEEATTSPPHWNRTLLEPLERDLPLSLSLVLLAQLSSAQLRASSSKKLKASSSITFVLLPLLQKPARTLVLPASFLQRESRFCSHSQSSSSSFSLCVCLSSSSFHQITIFVYRETNSGRPHCLLPLLGPYLPSNCPFRCNQQFVWLHECSPEKQ
uniref:Uncharacterized protein n=1 Tax=Oryza glumipatula TaxID=40148 RepID=A0A0D9Z2D3_9ORYZ